MDVKFEFAKSVLFAGESASAAGLRQEIPVGITGCIGFALSFKTL